MKKNDYLQHMSRACPIQGKTSKIGSITRLMIALLIVSINFAFANGTYAQKTALSLDVSNKCVADVINEIENQSDFNFYYNAILVDVERKVSIKVNNENIYPILDKLFTNSDTEYEVLGTDVILSEKKSESQYVANTTQQQITIKGVVADETGETLPGVSVTIKGTTAGTITDVDGAYSIPVNSENAVLVFSFIGYTRLEETVGSRKTINVTMSENIQEMEEVVVIGYGTVKKANLSGAVGTTDSKTFQSRPVQNASSALQGEVPGLTIIRTSGAPGSSPTIRIRDVSSINEGSPLILIDGAEGELNMINAADIDNISVLKDGTAAIYGARAADGVILITTKTGKKNQKLRVTVDASYSFKKPALLKKTASLYQHAVMGLEITDGSFPIEYTKEELALILDNSNQVLPTSDWGRWKGYPKFYQNQDWNDIMIGSGSLQNYNVNLTGGGDKYSYLVSLGHQSEDGFLKFGTDNDKRYFVRAKSNIQIIKGLDYDFNLSYEASNRDYSSGIAEGQNIWELIYKTRSWAPLRNPAGNFYTFEGFDNPAQVLEDGGMAYLTTGNITFNNQLRWQVIDGLNLIGRAIVRKRDNDKNIENKTIKNYNWDNVNHRISRNPNSASREYDKTLSKNFTLYAEYKKTLEEKHNIGIMVGGAHESADYDRFAAKRINFDKEDPMSLQLGGSENQEAWSEGNAWTINSFFSRLNYAFANKYLIEGTLRIDGSSRFHADHRWGYFPGASAAWRIGEESFMKSLDIFDDLKLRASYGEMGNQSGIGLYDYISVVSVLKNYYPFGEGSKGQMANPGSIVSTDRTWETIKTKNIGIDFALLDNRLYGSFDYFWKNNNNMLIPITYPAMLGTLPANDDSEKLTKPGIYAPTTNSGQLKINGWEVAIGWRDQAGDFNYSVRASLSDTKNEVVNRIGSNLIELGLNKTPKGYPLSSYFGYEFDGIIQNEQELAEYKARFVNGGIPGNLAVGDAKYKDLDGDGLLSVLGDNQEGGGDVAYLGNTNPKYSFGLNLNAEYKGFDLGIFIQGVGKRTMFLEGEADKPFSQPWFQSAEYWYGKTWTPERTDAKYPAITSDGKRGYNYYISSNTKHNVGYGRLKNLQFGYTLPKSISLQAKFEKVRFYFSGEDLFEVHNAPGGWDPEDGGSYVGYPFARNYAFGVNVVF